MVSNEHSFLRENIPAYAVGALDAEEAAALDAHLKTCKACQAELAAYRLLSDDLLAATPPQEPSAALRKRLQSQLPSARPAERKERPRFVWSFNQLAMGLALLLLFAINAFSFVQMRALQGQQSNLLHQLQNSQAAVAMLSYPGTQSLPIHEGNIGGTVLVDKDRNSVALIVWNLPQLNTQQTYQIWLIEPSGHRVSAGLFRPQAGVPYTTQPVFSNQNLSNFVGIGVTVEPAGGSDQPTGPRVFKVDF
jgi:anti-sigma-K factor RskA